MSEKLYLIFSFEDLGHQPRPHSSREPHGRLGLVQLGISLIPVEDPHHQEMTEDRIVDPLPVLESELLRTTDHVRPQSVIVVEVRKLVPLPSSLIKAGFFTRDPLPMASFLGNLHAKN